MKKLPFLLCLITGLFLSACGKHGVSGFYSFGSTGYDFAPDGHVSVYDKQNISKVIVCTYILNGDTVQVSSAETPLGHTTLNFKLDTAGLHALERQKFTYTLSDLTAFKASAPAPVSTFTGHEKSF